MHNILCHSVIIITGAIFLIPSPSYEHFIWPLSWCLLADICNHTWIPECGNENETDFRMFIDECDMYEYNCDNERDYEVGNYSDCFRQHTGCPTSKPCPSFPTCKESVDKQLRRGRRRHMTTGPRAVLKVTLPMRMLRGKRRYTPIPRRKRRSTTKRCSSGCGNSKPTKKTKRTKKTIPTKKVTIPITKRTMKKFIKKTKKESFKKTTQVTKKISKTTTLQTVILKQETIFRSGKKLLRIVKGVVWQSGKPLKIVAENHDPNSGYLQ